MIELIALALLVWALIATYAARRYRAAAHDALAGWQGCIDLAKEAGEGWMAAEEEARGWQRTAKAYQRLAGVRRAPHPSGMQATRDLLN